MRRAQRAPCLPWAEIAGTLNIVSDMAAESRRGSVQAVALTRRFR